MPNQPNEPAPLAPLPMPEPSSIFSSPAGLLRLALSQWKLVLFCVILSSGLGAGYAYLATPIYDANARIEVLNDSRVETRSRSSYDRQERSLSRQLLLLNSSRLHQKVRSILSPVWSARLGPEELDVECLVSSVPGSDGTMIDFNAEAVNPEYATAYITTMIEVYRQLRIEELNEVNESAVTGLRVEETRVLRELEDAKQELSEFEHTNQMQLSREREAMNLAFVNQLFDRLQTVSLERALLENQYDTIHDANVVTILEALQMTRDTQGRSRAGSEAEDESNERGTVNPSLVGVALTAESQNAETVIEWEQNQEELAKKKREYEQLLLVRKKAHPSMVALAGAIQELEHVLESKVQLSLKRFEARYDALKLQEAGIEKVLSNWKKNSLVSVEGQNRYRQLVSKVAFLEKKYDLVYGRLLENTGDTESFFLRNIQEPFSSGLVIKPQKIKILAAALVFGFMLSGGLILGFELIRSKELNVEHLKREFHLTYLSSILRWDLYLPSDKFNPKEDHLVVVKGENQVATETYRRIRLNILKELDDPAKFSFAVTSGKDGDGKTFNSANIAVPFAWDGKRVLLIDADLRRSSLAKNLLRKTSKHGLADWLRDESCDVQQYIVKLDEESIYVLPAGTYDDSLPELVNALRLRRLIQSLQQDFDVIILDTAPVTVLSETILQCRATDGIVLILDTLSNEYDVRHCINELSGVRILGFCINNVDDTRSGRGNYGGYSAYETYSIDTSKPPVPRQKRWWGRAVS